MSCGRVVWAGRFLWSQGAARLDCVMGGAQWLIESLQPKPAAEEEVKRLDEHIRSLAVAAEAVGEAEASTTPSGSRISHLARLSSCWLLRCEVKTAL